MSVRIGVDIGGTFTDLIWFDELSGEIKVAKVPTTPSDPAQGCLAAIDTICRGTDLADASFFVHATTVGLNAILERRGAIVGLLTTEGFRDILALRRGSREDPYDLGWQPPPPLVPRRRRLGVRERIASDGTVIVPLRRESVLSALATLRLHDVDAIAVCLLNAYRYPEHELAIESILRDAGFAGVISLSHRLSREYQEYERTSTTVIDAFVGQRMGGYLRSVATGLSERGFKGESLITRSGGGAMSFDEARERAFETIMSGPVAGVSGAAEISRALGLDAIITADVGGTSFDTCVVLDGKPDLLASGRVDGMPIQTPWVDVRSIGAGGGSIAHLDDGGLLIVGPESTGAMPGPACYGRGGTHATLTDAACLLGMLGEGEFVPGFRLDAEASRAAIRPLAHGLGTHEMSVAQGIVRIAAANMAGAIREITIENGRDPRKMVLLAFGGAGPMMATAIAHELDLDHVIVPAHAGNFSAWGLLGADLVRSRARTYLAPLQARALSEVARIGAEMVAEMREGAESRHADYTEQVALDLRYSGQEYSLTIPLDIHACDAERLKADLAERYALTFGSIPDSAPEVRCIRASLRRVLPKRRMASVESGEMGSGKRIPAFSFSKADIVPFAVVARSALPAESALAGPMIVTEPTTTTYVDADFDVRVDHQGLLHLHRRRISQ